MLALRFGSTGFASRTGADLLGNVARQVRNCPALIPVIPNVVLESNAPRSGRELRENEFEGLGCQGKERMPETRPGPEDGRAKTSVAAGIGRPKKVLSALAAANLLATAIQKSEFNRPESGRRFLPGTA